MSDVEEKGYGGLYKAPTKEERRMFCVLKMASWKIQESKKKARRSINCMFWDE